MGQRKILVNIDFKQNEIQKAVIENLSAAPSSPKKGQIYYDATLNLLGVYNNSKWIYQIPSTNQAWGTYSDTITWSTNASSGGTHEYGYVKNGKLVNGFIRLEFSGGSLNTWLSMATNDFPVIANPTNAAVGEYITACSGYFHSGAGGSGSPVNTRSWLERSSNTSGFMVKVLGANTYINTLIVNFIYMTS